MADRSSSRQHSLLLRNYRGQSLRCVSLVSRRSSRANTPRQPSALPSATVVRARSLSHLPTRSLGTVNELHLFAPLGYIPLPFAPSSAARLHRACVSAFLLTIHDLCCILSIKLGVNSDGSLEAIGCLPGSRNTEWLQPQSAYCDVGIYWLE